MGITSVNGANNVQATQKKWEDGAHSAMKELPYYTIQNWFRHIFCEKTTIIDYEE